MKILAISHIFPPAIDGGSKVIYQLSHHLETQGHQVIYLSSDCSSTDDFVKSKYKKISTIYHLRSNIYLPVYHHLRRPLRLLEIVCTKFLFINPKSYFIDLIKIYQKGPIFKFFPFLKATIKILKFKPDLIIAGPLPTTIILYANFLKKISTIYHLRPKILLNSSFHQNDPDFSRLPLIKTLHKADFLWTLTKYETDFFIKKLNISPAKIILAGNGVESDFLITKTKTEKLKSDKLTILYIGSLASHKRVDLLIKSFSTIYNLRSNISLIIVGQKTLFFPQIQKLYQSLPKAIQKQIHFNFNINNKELINIIDNCQFLVLPSIQESFGLVLIEALARKKAVITSDIPSLKEIVNQTKGGLIFKTDNQSDLEEKIKMLISQPKLCYQLGQNGHTYVKNNYTWSKVSQKICQKISSSL